MEAALALTALLLAVAAVAVGAYFVGSPEEAVIRAVALGSLTFVVVGGLMALVFHARSVKSLDLPSEELDGGEVVWAKTSGSMVHYRSGNPLKFWEAVGGKLFLTNRVLEFCSHAGQPWSYRLTIPLEQVREACPCRVLGLFPGGLRVERVDGTSELFTFGAAFDVSGAWADAILDFRDDLVEEEGPARGGGPSD